MSYPFVAAWFDYGSRKGPALGLLYHMAEGGGTVGYLDKTGTSAPRGVSVHAVCDYAGVVTQMLPWDHASGSLNPADRSTDKAYFGHSTLVDVLGGWWTDPNSAVLSMEIEGFAAKGPNPAQVKAAIAWGLDMRLQFPTLRGAIGHADQTDTKGCPGTTAAMKAIFMGVGGHGLFASVPDTSTGGAAMLTPGKLVYLQAVVPTVGKPIRSGTQTTAPIIRAARAGDQFPLLGNDGAWFAVRIPGNTVAFILHADGIQIETPQPAPVTDCTAAVADALVPVNAELATTKTALQQAEGARVTALLKGYAAAKADALKAVGGI